MLEGNLANLNKLLKKGKPTAEVLEDRLSKVVLAQSVSRPLPPCDHNACEGLWLAQHSRRKVCFRLQIDQVKAAIDAIPDGVHGRRSPARSPVKRPDGGEAAGPSKGAAGAIHIEARGRGQYYFESTAESTKFLQARTTCRASHYTGTSNCCRQSHHTGSAYATCARSHCSWLNFI